MASAARVIPAAIDVLERVAPAGFTLRYTEFPWSCDYYRKHGRMLEADGIDKLQEFGAIYLGAIGDPKVPDHVSVWELILPIASASISTSTCARCVCCQAWHARSRTWPGGRGHDLRARELGGRVRGPRRPDARRDAARSGGADRPVHAARHRAIARYAFEVASRRPRKKLASATKSNAMQHSMVLWDQTVEAVAKDYPGVEWRKYHVDALAARMVTDPGSLDVILASNLFGDILTDLGAAVSGSLGVAPGANLNPERTFPSMFEPIHGSAPDIAGRGIANPIGAIWAGALMLEHLGVANAQTRIVKAIERVLGEGGPRTPDLGGKATTKEVAAAIASAVNRNPGPVRGRR